MRYGYNTDFLDEDSELRSYFLGFFVADGWLGSQGLGSLRLSCSDQQIIYDIANATGYVNKITESRNRAYGGGEFTGTTQYHLAYAGPPRDVIKALGFTSDKTGHEFVPTGISGDTFCHFMRGLSDGDGSFGIYNVKSYRILKYSLVSASFSFLEDILEHLKRISVIASTTVIRPSQTAQNFQFGHADSVRLGYWMYANATLKMERKHDIWLAGTRLKRTRKTWTPAEINLVQQGVQPKERTRTQYLMKRYRLGFGYQ